MRRMPGAWALVCTGLLWATLVGCTPTRMEASGQVVGADGTVGPGGPSGGGSTGSGGGTGAGGSGSGTGTGTGTETGTGTLPDEERDPGRVTMRRLNRAEYDNTVRDLLGLELGLAQDFPDDDFGYGFDNIGDVLTISPLLLEGYERAAEQAAREAMRRRVDQVTLQFEATQVGGSVGGAQGEFWNLWSTGHVTSTVQVPLAGRYRISVLAYGDQAGPDPARMRLTVDGAEGAVIDVPATRSSPDIYTATAIMGAGARSIGVHFINDYYVAESRQDRNLLVGWVRVQGPEDAPGEDSPARQRIMVCQPDPANWQPCAREILEKFVRRAWRRPATGEEIERLMGLVAVAVAEGDRVDEGITVALSGALLSPHFLFRVEVDPDPGASEPRRLNDHELATRLSYFLWSTMPDAELFALADAGQLQDEEVLRAQVRRMLGDPKAVALVDNFAGQWLYTRAIANAFPDYVVFRDFDEELRQAMIEEARLFFHAFVQEDLSLGELLTADFTYVNERLARHYGIEGIQGTEMQRVELSDAQRGGILSQAGILTVTSYPTRTSPVKRGHWVLSHLLCIQTPAPPPGVEAFTEEPQPTATLRERFERHSRDPNCSVCHAMMDPIGFGMENYDGVGAWRTQDKGGFAIDASGTLPGYGDFSGVAELASILAGHPNYVPCVTRQLMTYGLGRGPMDGDEPYVEDIVEASAPQDYRMRTVIEEIVLSDVFRMRRGESAAAPGR